MTLINYERIYTIFRYAFKNTNISVKIYEEQSFSIKEKQKNNLRIS